MTTKITNYPETIKNLAAWIEDIKEAAKDDNCFSIAWFEDTKDSPFSIIAGWEKRFTNQDFSDLFCTSKSNPEYVMCVKVAVNEGPYAYTDFEAMNMPLDKNGDEVQLSSICNDDDTFTYSNKVASAFAEGLDMSEEDEDEISKNFLIENADGELVDDFDDAEDYED